MVFVFDERLAVFRDAGIHELTDHAAEVGRHEHRFEARDAPRIKLLIDESDEADELFHRRIDVFSGQPVGNDCFGIEPLTIYRRGSTCRKLRTFCHLALPCRDSNSDDRHNCHGL